MPKKYVLGPSEPGRENLHIEVFSNEINIWGDEMNQMINLTPEEALELSNLFEKILRVKRTVYFDTNAENTNNG